MICVFSISVYSKLFCLTSFLGCIQLEVATLTGKNYSFQESVINCSMAQWLAVLLSKAEVLVMCNSSKWPMQILISCITQFNERNR